MYKHGLHLFLAALCFIVCCQPVAAAHVPSSLEEHASEKADLILKNRVWDFCGYPAECAEQKALQVQQSQWVAKAGRSRIVLGQALQRNGDGSVGGYLLNTTYEPSDFILTTKDGHVYHYNISAGLVDEHDRNGVSLTFTHTGIFSSTGASITYVRDAVTDRIVAVTDPNGNQITYGYDSSGNLISKTDEAGRKVSYTYLATPAHYLNNLLDANGNPLSKTAYTGDGRLSTFTDALGNITTFFYDTAHLLQTKIEPLDPTTNTNPTVVTFYDSRGNVIQTTNEIGSISTTTYDANNNPLVVIPPCGCKTTYTYDSNGNQLTSQDPLGNVTTNTYDSNNNLTSVTDPRGNQTTYHYDVNGNLISMIEPLGGQTQLTDDDLGRATALTDALGHTTQFTYIDDPNTGIAATKPSIVTRIDGSVVQFTYNSFGSVTSETDENGNIIQLITDSGGILQQRIDADGSTTNYSYDSNSNLISITDASGGITSMTYDLAFNLIERDGPNGEVTKFNYDQMNRLSNKIDPLGRTTTRHYRADGILQSITQADGSNIAFDLDINGRRTGLTDPTGNHTTITYNGNSRVTAETDPLGHTSTYSYDPSGNLSQMVDRLGRIRQFTYNSNNQLIQEQWLTSINSQAIKTITTNYDSLGNVTSANDDSGTLMIGYDNRNRLKTATTIYGTQSPFILNYAYDLGSRLTNVTDGDGVSVGTQYDVRNNVTQINWVGPNITARLNFTHDPLGDITSIKRYGDLGGIQLIGQSSYVYPRNLLNTGYPAIAYNSGDETQTTESSQTETFGALDISGSSDASTASGMQGYSRLGGVVHQDSLGNTILSESYTTDQAGQLSTKTVANDTTAFGYDKTGELINTSHTSLLSLNENYTYDSSGNRLTTGAQVTNNTVTADNRIAKDATYAYTYDSEGNVATRTEIASGNVWTYAYDLRNRMTGALETSDSGVMLSSSSYSYDVLNRRISKTVNGLTTVYFYQGDNIWKQTISGTITTRYLAGSLDEWLARSNGTTLDWYLTDRLGSVTGITDSSGNLLNVNQYDSYGHITSQSNPSVADAFGFTGREFDSETGLYYLRSRYYNPDLGKFQSEDPLEFGAGDYNISRYVSNDPTNGVDLYGLAQKMTPQIKQKRMQEYYQLVIAVRQLAIRCAKSFGLQVAIGLATDGLYILAVDGYIKIGSSAFLGQRYTDYFNNKYSPFFEKWLQKAWDEDIQDFQRQIEDTWATIPVLDEDGGQASKSALQAFEAFLHYKVDDALQAFGSPFRLKSQGPNVDVDPGICD